MSSKVHVTSEGPDATIKSVLVLYVTTLIHHIYGGIIYGSLERIIIGVVFSVVMALTLWLYSSGKVNRWARLTYRVIVATFWVGLVGLYEGGFNHVLYSFLRLTNSSPQLVEQLYFSGGDGVAPDDVFFQATGVLTFVAALLVVFSVTRMTRRGQPVRGAAPA